MLIIVEGPDGTGKSTLVSQIADKFNEYNVKIMHAGPPTGHPLDEYVVPLVDYQVRHAYSFREFVICDRWHLGELVYPTVLDRPSLMDINTFTYIEMFLAARGAMIVHMTDTTAYLESVLRGRGDDLVKPEQSKLMIDMFWNAVNVCNLPVMTIDAHEPTLGMVVDIVDQAMIYEDIVDKLGPFVTYVGGAEVDTLLVGDVRGGDPSTHGRKPAFMPYPNSCGEYLLRALGSVNALKNVGIVNANDGDNIRNVWAEVGRPHIVALGVNAKRTVELMIPRTKITYVPHPQWWKRFRYNDYEEYGKMITGNES